MLDEALALDFSVGLTLAVAGVVIVPQLIAYVLSALSGSASSPFAISFFMSFTIWSIVKAFIIASGTLLATALVSVWNHWPLSKEQLFTLVSSSFLFLMLPFLLLYLYYEADKLLLYASNRFPKLQKFHALCTRNRIGEKDRTVKSLFDRTVIVSIEISAEK